MTNLPPPALTRPPAQAPHLPSPDPADRIFDDRQHPQPKRRAPLRRDIGLLTPLLAVALVPVAVVGNLALQTGLSSLATPLAVGAAAVFLWRTGSVKQGRSLVMIGAAVLVALWLPLRDSGWLTALNTLVSCALLVAAVLFDRHPLPRLSARSVTLLSERLAMVFAAPLLLLRSFPFIAVPNRAQAKAPAVAIARGLALAALPIVVLAGFLAQADAVFASALTADLHAGAFVRHALVSGFVALALAGLVCVARSGSTEDPGRPGLIGGVEVVTVLSCVFALFSAFAAAQVVGSFGDVDGLLADRGITHAEYARGGFFQLLTVASLTLLMLSSLRAVARPTVGPLDTLRRLLGAAVCLLTVLIVSVSIHRLGLYVDAFGQTTLRWYSTAFAWSLGVVFVLYAANHLLASKRSWFAGALAGVFVASLLAVNVINPEHRVAQHNLTQDATESDLDFFYLLSLSADAWPAVVEHGYKLPPNTTVAGSALGPAALLDVSDHLCVAARAQPGWGVFGFNLARNRLVCKTERG